MQLIYDQHRSIADFVAAMIPDCARGFGDNIKTIGVIDNDGRLVAGLVYHNYDPDHGIIEISGAAITPRWLTRPVIRAMYEYPFVQLGCQMIVTRQRADNERLLAMYARYGFTFYKIKRMYGRGVDGVIGTLTDDDWRSNGYDSCNGSKFTMLDVSEAAE